MKKHIHFQNLKYNGGVALTTVIILTALLMLSGTTIVLTSIDLRKSTKNNSSYIQAEINFDSCIEESVHRIKFNPTFTGSFSINLLNGSCQSIVSNDANPAVKVFNITSISEGSTYTGSIKVDTSTYPFEIVE